MKNCPYNNTCIKYRCDFACKSYAEFEHWANRCSITLLNPLFLSGKDKISQASRIIRKAESDDISRSSYLHLGIYSGDKSQLTADLIAYLAILRYCQGSGLYHGVYKLNFSQYLDEIKKSWNTKSNSEKLEDIKIWIRSSKCLVICNLGLVRFGDFESQTLLSIFQERYDQEKYTIVVLDGGKLSLPGKADSVFYQKLKNEIALRGVRV